MVSRRSALILIFILLGFNHLFAQEPQKTPAKKKKPPKNISEASKDTTAIDIHYLLFPEFYYYWPIDKGDTVLKYQCYDAKNNLINVDTLHNVNDVRHIYFVKSFTNYMHTFIDADGKPRPSSVNKTLYSYDKTDIDSWNSMDYTHHYGATLKENKSLIVRADSTLIVDPVTQTRQLTIRNYYKITEIKPEGQIEEEK